MNYTFKQRIVIDISLWERDIFWDRLSPRPYGVITKASEYKWKDPMVVEHSRNMTAGGYLRGLYHFFRENDVQAQVDLFLDVSKEVGAFVHGKWMWEFPPILDVEETPEKQGKNYAGQLKAWLDLVEKATRTRPIIYTSQFYWKFACTFLFSQPIAPTWTNRYPLWVAQYFDEPDLHDKPHPLPAGWTDYVGWQYATDGRFEGIPFDGVDVNVFKDGYLDTIDGEVGIPPKTISIFSNGEIQ